MGAKVDQTTVCYACGDEEADSASESPVFLEHLVQEYDNDPSEY